MSTASGTFLKEKYRLHKRRAERQAIPFLLDFSQWLELWTASGHLHERGRQRDQYCMARHGDIGAYEIGNVKIVTNAENCSEQDFSKRKMGRPPRPGGVDPVVAVRLPDDVLAEVERWAVDNGSTRSDAIRELIERGLKPR